MRVFVDSSAASSNVAWRFAAARISDTSKPILIEGYLGGLPRVAERAAHEASGLVGRRDLSRAELEVVLQAEIVDEVGCNSLVPSST